jgi:hypothetical protein
MSCAKLMMPFAERMLLSDVTISGVRPMPVPARLSRKLYETLGEEGASDLVDWMQAVEVQRSELRALSDLGLARLDARFDAFERRLDVRFQEVDVRLQAVEARFHEVDARFETFEARIIGRLEAKIEQRTADLMKWSFVFWVGAVGAIAVLAGVLR